MRTNRLPDHPIEPIFLDRWSPRAFDAAPIPEADLRTIMEAGRWAPSAFNIQPWRFLYARHGDANWQAFLQFLDPGNAAWAQNASALVVLLSDTVMPGDGDRPDLPSRTHSFDAGAAWTQLALQATALGYQAHAMAGLDFDAATRALEVPERYRVEIAIAIGRRIDPATLPQELRDRESPSQRLPLHDIAFAGRYPRNKAAAAA